MKKKNPLQLELEFKKTEYQTEFMLAQADDKLVGQCEINKAPDSKLSHKIKFTSSTESVFDKKKKL